MGNLIYEGVEYPFDDRVLAHVKAAVGRKFGMRESFFLSWTKAKEDGGGRMSLWMCPGNSLGFSFATSRQPELDESWLRMLSVFPNSARGMVVVSEREAKKYAKEHPQLH